MGLMSGNPYYGGNAVAEVLNQGMAGWNASADRFAVRQKTNADLENQQLIRQEALQRIAIQQAGEDRLNAEQTRRQTEADRLTGVRSQFATRMTPTDNPLFQPNVIPYAPNNEMTAAGQGLMGDVQPTIQQPVAGWHAPMAYQTQDAPNPAYADRLQQMQDMGNVQTPAAPLTAQEQLMYGAQDPAMDTAFKNYNAAMATQNDTPTLKDLLSGKWTPESVQAARSAKDWSLLKSTEKPQSTFSGLVTEKDASTGKSISGQWETQANGSQIFHPKGSNSTTVNAGGGKGTSTRNMNINGLSGEENTALDQAIQNGLDPYKVNSRTGKIYAQLEIQNPGRDWNKLGAQAQFERSSTTMQSRALLNTINPLLDKLSQAGGVLGNSSLPGYNRAVNFLKEQGGSADIVGFNNLRDDVVAEVERGLLGSGVLSDSKYNRAIKNVNSAQSMPQLQAAIDNTKMVINARLESLAKGPNATAPNQGQNAQKQAVPEAASGPKVGDVVKGYMYMGGNPSDRKSWGKR